MPRLLTLVLPFLACGLAAQDVILQGLTDGNYRFKDIGGQPYASSFSGNYSYAAAKVTISLDTPGLDYLAGSVSAAGLKPNFAYQIKLTGNPSKSGLSDADDATNEILGYHGRWWRLQPNPANSNDADYNANKDTPGYVYEGYILIAFFITDELGNANVRFVGDNSFHVLWRLDQRQPSPNDGPPVAVTVPDTGSSSAYDTTVPARQYTLYGEWEPTRVLPGALQLPLGHYRCRMFLTEESFHDTGPGAGQWAVALSAPLEFDIPTTVSGTQASALPLTITRVRAALNFVHPGHDFVWISGYLNWPAPATLEGTSIQAAILGATRTFSLNRFGSCWRPDGVLQLRPPRGGSGNTRFDLRVSRAALLLPQNSRQASAIETPLEITLGGQDYAGSVTAPQRRGEKTGTLNYTGK